MYQTHAERLRAIREEKPERTYTLIPSVQPVNDWSREETYQNVGNWKGNTGRKVGGPRS
jgi:hypothetical protein